MSNAEKIRESMAAAHPARAKDNHHHFTNTKAGRVIAVIQTLSGVACMLISEQIYSIFPYIIGGLMMIAGLINTVVGFRTKEFCKPETKMTANGVVQLLLGAVILYHHANADSLISSIWGVLGLVKGSEMLNASLYALSQKEPFLKKGILAVIDLLLGILLLNDASAVKHHVLILGVELVVLGWQNFRETKSMM